MRLVEHAGLEGITTAQLASLVRVRDLGGALRIAQDRGLVVAVEQDRYLGAPALAQAAEAIRLLAGQPPLFADRLLTIDVWTGTWRSVPLARRLACAACGPGLGAPIATRSIAS